MIRRKAKLSYGSPAIIKEGWILGWWIYLDPVTKSEKFQFLWEDGQDGSMTVEDIDYGSEVNASTVTWSFADGQPDVIPVIP